MALDDTIAGATALSAPAVRSSVGLGADQDDVYKVTLAAGQKLTARVSGPSDTNIDLYLYGPTAATLDDTDKIVGFAFGTSYPDALHSESGAVFVAPQSGTYYLDVFALSGGGDYLLEWGKGVEPTVTIGRTVGTVAYGQTSKVTGKVVGTSTAGVVGEKVELWSALYPSLVFRRALSSVTGTGGVYSFTVAPNRWTRYKILTLGTKPGYAAHETGWVNVKAKVGLGTPHVSDATKYRNKNFSVWGSLRPKHSAGWKKSVKIRCYKRQSDGSYKWVKTVWAKNVDYSSTVTKYLGTVSLPYRGTWRLYAHAPDDGLHAATTSGYRRIVVR